MFLSKYSIINYFQLKTIDPNFEQEHALVSFRATGFGWYEGSNDLAMILVATIPFLFYFFEAKKNYLIKFISIAVVVLFSYNLMITGSRGGILGFLTIVILTVFSAKKINKPLKIAFLSVAIVGAIPIGLKIVQQRSDVVDGSYTQDASAQDRITQWKAGIKMLILNPLTGVGPEQFPEVAGDYGGIRGLQPHNTIIQVFAETGFIGGIFFILMNVYAFKDIRFFLKVPNISQNALNDLLIYKYLSYTFIGFWVCALFSNRNQAYILFVVIAMMVAVKSTLMGQLPENIDEES
ncbi:O-antigen ligase family protein [candidate division KSB1 bacterium]|nr:O-antigen ligase family protein [candidate division KSB1 bacterium]